MTVPTPRPDRLAADLAVRPEVRLIDFTGGNAFGDWLEEHARQATVFTEKAGVNTVVVDSTDDVKAMLGNLAFSFSLYTGQMCTAPQNVYLPADGIETDEGHWSVADVAAGLDKALPTFPADAKGMATRKASGEVLNALADVMPELWGGSADLAGSNNTTMKGATSFVPKKKQTAAFPGDEYGRTLHFGIRENAMR